MAFTAEQKKAWRRRPEVKGRQAVHNLKWDCKNFSIPIDEEALRRLRNSLKSVNKRSERLFSKSISLFVAIGRNGLSEKELKRIRDKFRKLTPAQKAAALARRRTPKGRARILANHFRRWKNDVQYRMAHSFRAKLRARIARHKGIKSHRSVKLFGCTTQFLILHIESQWLPWMNWDNYGKSWCIDHIVPCKAFDLTDPAQQLICFNWQNLRPLSIKKNSEKSDTVTLPQLPLPLPFLPVKEAELKGNFPHREPSPRVLSSHGGPRVVSTPEFNYLFKDYREQQI